MGNNTEESSMERLYRMKLSGNLKGGTGDVSKHWDIIKYTITTTAIEE
jgi:hypothetical protein